MTTAELTKLGYTVIDGRAVKISDVPKQDRPAPKHRTIRRFISTQVVSEANQGGKLKKKIKRKLAQKLAITSAFDGELMNAGTPKRVTFVLLTNQPQDDDNFSRSCKVFRDQIARSCGFDDKARIWKYRQEPRRNFEARGLWIVIEW